MTITDFWIDLMWDDLTECARAKIFATLLAAGVEIPDKVLESKTPITTILLCNDEWESE